MLAGAGTDVVVVELEVLDDGFVVEFVDATESTETLLEPELLVESASEPEQAVKPEIETMAAVHATTDLVAVE